jgi:hypothetical protein
MYLPTGVAGAPETFAKYPGKHDRLGVQVFGDLIADTVKKILGTDNNLNYA